MAKYNLAKFNRAKYNISADGQLITDSLVMAALFQANVGLGQKTKDALRLDSTFLGKCQMASGTIDKSTLDAVITSEAAVKYIEYGLENLEASFESETYLSPVVNDKLTCAAEISANVYLGSKVQDSIILDAEVNGSTYLGNDITDPDGIMAYAIFGATASAESLDEIVLDINCTIPAGGVLVIDSENFRVLLNSQNAIKYHSGDWIDCLNRNSKIIKIEGGANSLDADIYFQELWL